MIELHQFPTSWGLLNTSPFCMKAEVYLKMADLPYQVVTLGDPRKAPKGKMPFLVDEGRKVPDSQHIVEYLIGKYGDRTDKDLSAAERRRSDLIRIMLEEHLYFMLIWTRWVEDSGWAVSKPAFFSTLPALVRAFVPNMIRKQMVERLRHQGLGRHSKEELIAFGKRDLDILAGELGEQPFFMGPRPTAVDASAYATIASFLVPPIENPLKAHLKTHQNLVAYHDRMKQKYG